MDTLVNNANETNQIANSGTTTAIETKVKSAKTPAKSKSEKTMTTRDMAKILGMTSKQLRRILRDTDKYDDGKYTRYLLTKQDLDAVKKKISGK
jgi:phage antirepressor YoqD-like protein